VTIPGVPVSPGIPPLEHAARDAIHAARSRVDALTRGNLPFPVRELSGEEKEAALRDAATQACKFCSALHPGASTAACPRLATFKLNGDGDVTEGSFWPEGAVETVTEIRDGRVVSEVHRTRSEWDTSRVVFVQDVAEEEPGEGGEDGAHPA
jgi:hypothetical protein